MARKRQRKKDRQATHQLEDVEVTKVDLVGEPATGDRFLVIRSDEAAVGEPVEPDPEPVERGPDEKPPGESPERASDAVQPEGEGDDPPQEETPSQEAPEASEDVPEENPEEPEPTPEEITRVVLDPGFQEEAVKATAEIVAEAQELLREIQEFQVGEDGAKELPEDTLEGFNGLGVQVARAVLEIGVEDFEPGQALWDSIQRAGAKMARNRLQKFRQALDALGSILTELEGGKKEEKRMGDIKRDQDQPEETTTEETTTAKPEEKPEEETATEEKPEEETQPEMATEEKPVKEEVARAEVQIQGLDEIMAKLDTVARSQEETQKGLKNLATRLDTVERSAGIPNGTQPEDPEPVKREKEEKPFWGNITGHGKK